MTDISKNAELQQSCIAAIVSRCFSYLAMRKVRLFTPTMGGNIYVYKDCYGVKWLAYSDFPRKRCLYNGL